MIARVAATRVLPGSPSSARHRGAEDGSLSLEAVMVLPVLALLVLGMLEVAGVVRDVMVVHEAARAGARAAATSTGDAAVSAAARSASPEIDVAVLVDPLRRSDGDVVTVTVTTDRRIGPVTHRIRARAVARVEPAVGTTPLGRMPP